MEARPDIDSLCCMNKKCKYFQRPEPGRLYVRKTYGKDNIRFLRCTHCSKEFSERRGSALFNMKISEERAESVIDHIRQGCGFRATVSLTGVSKEAVSRLMLVTGESSERHSAEVAETIHTSATFGVHGKIERLDWQLITGVWVCFFPLLCCLRSISVTTPIPDIASTSPHLHIPPALHSIAGVHPEEIGGKESGLAATGAGPDLHYDVPLIVGVPGKKGQLDLPLHQLKGCIQGRDLLLGQGRQGRVGPFVEDCLGVLPLRLPLTILAIQQDHLFQAGPLLGQDLDSLMVEGNLRVYEKMLGSH